MNNETSKTLSLLPTNEDEEHAWRRLLEAYAWADGEFGMICTEAAFREFADEAATNTALQPEIKRAAAQYASLLDSGCFSDVCLERGISPF